MVFYLNPIKVGIDLVQSRGDGTIITVKWFEAKSSNKNNKIAYNIYFSTIKERVFSEGPKFLSIDDSIEANIIDLTPGQEYFFSVRPIEYNGLLDLTILPIAYDNLRFYPSSLLSQAMTNTTDFVPLQDLDNFPNSGVVKIGVELVSYLSTEVSTIVNTLSTLVNITRGFGSSQIRNHSIDGYDGYYFSDPEVRYTILGEDTGFDRIYACQSRFEFPFNAFTFEDGYKQVTKDILTSDLSVSDESNENFPAYDYSGYHRTDPVQLLTGVCVGSYIGGEQGCIDGYGNVNIVRGLDLQSANNQREEVLLTIVGRPAVLLQQMRTGIICNCYQSSSEYQDDRCPFCFGTKFVVGYQQYFDTRRSDRRILVRISPSDENLKMNDAGLESELNLDAWTLTVPTIKTRDVIVLFDIADNEEFRYEVSYVTRNNTLVGMQGAQKMKLIRIRKTDPAYQVPIFKNTSSFPSTLDTSISGNDALPPHKHTIVKNEHDPSTWQQVTSVTLGHCHPVIISPITNLPEVQIVLNHTHTIII